MNNDFDNFRHYRLSALNRCNEMILKWLWILFEKFELLLKVQMEISSFMENDPWNLAQSRLKKSVFDNTWCCLYEFGEKEREPMKKLLMDFKNDTINLWSRLSFIIFKRSFDFSENGFRSEVGKRYTLVTQVKWKLSFFSLRSNDKNGTDTILSLISFV